MKKLILLIAVLLLPTLCFAKSDIIIPDFQSSIYEDDETAEWKGKVEGIKKAIEESPEDPALYFLLAWSYDMLEDNKNALKAYRLHYEYLPEEEKKTPETYGNMGRACLLNGLYKEARKWLNKADELDPTNIYNRLNSARCYILQNKYAEAAQEIKKSAELYGVDTKADPYHQMIEFCGLMKIPEDKILLLMEEAFKINPESHLACRALGTAYRNQKPFKPENFDKTLEYMHKAYEMNPKFPLTPISIANTYLFYANETEEKEYYDKSLEWFTKALELDPENYKTLFSLSVLYLRLKDEDKAMETLERAYDMGLDEEKKFEMESNILNNKAYKIYQSGENLEEGLRLANQGLMMNPKDAYLLSTKAELLYKMGRYEEAHRYILKSLEIMPDNKESQQDLKNIEEALRKP